jgi:hypothetical protein
MPQYDRRPVRQMQNSTIGTPTRHAPMRTGLLESAGYDFAGRPGRPCIAGSARLSGRSGCPGLAGRPAIWLTTRMYRTPAPPPSFGGAGAR